MASQGIPDTQKAWIITQRGEPKQSLKLVTSWPVPKKLKAGEVLVRVQAAALNPVGWKLMKLLPNFIARRPHIAEHDLSGVIVDSNGTHFKNGDEVFGWIPSTLTMKTGQGALAQFVRLPADHLISRPENVTPVQAAGLSLVGLTAYQALYNVADLEAGETIFVSGGSTAVGAFAIQIAKAAGAKVVATASAKNETFVRNLGADEFIDYTQVNLAKCLAEKAPSPKFDIIFDAVGSVDPTLYTSSEAYLVPNGVFVTTGPLPHKGSAHEFWQLSQSLCASLTPSWLGGTKRPYRIVSVNNDQKNLRALQELVANRSIKPVVDSVFDFDNVLGAYERIMTTRATGKVVVKVDPTVS